MMIKASFIGANPNPRVVGLKTMEYKCNYFLGNDPAKWRTDVPNYQTILLERVYPGIDLRYYGDGHRMEYDFVVSPGSDYSQIEIRYEGVRSLATNDRGDLELAPVVYQLDKEIHRPISGGYRLSGKSTFGFQLDGRYDPALPVIIDPVLVYSTYLGGENWDHGYGIAVDGSGCAYVTGNTESTDFPMQNPYDGSYNGGNDVFVTKLSAAGNGLVYSTYLGGGAYEGGFSIAVDGSGCACVTGNSLSSDFPMQNPYDGSYSVGTYDAFVTKLSAAGSSLVYSTYLGGAVNEWGEGIAVDDAGCAYVTGYTSSPDFPMQNPYNGTRNGYYDAFVTKLAATGDGLVFSTYLGMRVCDG
jgi:hypothetical protein